jgi:hypothetical protein
MYSNREDVRRRWLVGVAVTLGCLTAGLACDDEAGPVPSVATGMNSASDNMSGTGGSDSEGNGGRADGTSSGTNGTGETGPDIGGINAGGGGGAGNGGAGGGSVDPACASDIDFDNIADCLDGCPSDVTKVTAGVCGCGIPDTDIDGDTTLDCEETCPTDPTKTAPGACGCDRADVDTDLDGPLDCDDACPFDATRIVEGACGCGAADDLPLCLRHRYSFDGLGTTALDSAGTDNGEILGGATLLGDGTLTLAGLASDQYVDLPDGIISSLGSSATFELWLTWTGEGAPWQRIFDFGSSEQAAGLQGGGVTYLFVTPSNTINTHLRAAFTNAAPPAERTVNAPTALPFKVPVHLALVVDGTAATMSMYQDGVAVGSVETLDTTLAALDDVNNWIGRSQFIADEEFQGVLDEVRIYGVARNAEQVAAAFAAGPNDLPDE